MKLTILKPIVEHDVSNVRIPEEFNRYPTILTPIEQNPEPRFIPSAAEENIDEEIKFLCLEDAKIEGFIKGAIIVHVRIAVENRTMPLNWGVVAYLNETSYDKKPWKPVRCKWLTGSFEDCDPKDLRIIMPALDLAILKKRVISREL